MNKTEIKRIFKDRKIQLSPDGLKMIEAKLHRTVMNIADRCKHGNIKRLTSDLMYLVEQ